MTTSNNILYFVNSSYHRSVLCNCTYIYYYKDRWLSRNLINILQHIKEFSSIQKKNEILKVYDPLKTYIRQMQGIYTSFHIKINKLLIFYIPNVYLAFAASSNNFVLACGIDLFPIIYSSVLSWKSCKYVLLLT